MEQSLDMGTGFVGQSDVYLHPEIYRSLLSYEDLSKFGQLALVQLARSPLYDMLHGGFFRSLRYERAEEQGQELFDPKRVSHRSNEKLLIENCEMLSIYIEAWKLSDNPFFSQIAHEILDWIVDECRRGEKENLQFDSAINSGESFSRVHATDIMNAVDGRHRQAVQLFMGLNGNSTLPYLATEVPLLADYLGEEPVDLRLALTDSLKKLREHKQALRASGELKETRVAPSRLADLHVLRALAMACFSFDTPQVASYCETLVERYQSEDASAWTLRERAAWIRALCAMTRLYTAHRDHERAREVYSQVETLISVLDSPLTRELKYATPFVGDRIDLCDHTGMSGGAELLHALLDFNALQRMGLRGAVNLPVDVGPLLSASLELSRPLGLFAAGVYSALMRYLKTETKNEAHA